MEDTESKLSFLLKSDKDKLSVVAVLYSTKYFNIGRVITLTALVGITFIVGVICYVIYYHLDKTAS